MNLFDALIEDSIIAPLPLKNGEQRREIWICIRTDGAIGEGSRVNPYNGATQPLFDALMRFVNETSKVQANMTVRLGPGVFQTRGGDGGGFVGAWRPQSGQRIIGSGMHATILQLVDAGAIFQDVGQNVIGSNSNVNNFEISDLTLDCNFARQLNPDGDPDNYNNVMLAGVGLNGRNNRIRRVRVINFGTSNFLECFPLWLATPAVRTSTDRGNPIIEDCIVELPNDGNGRETTCISVYGDSNTASPGAGGVLRNTYINCEFANPPRASASRNALLKT